MHVCTYSMQATLQFTNFKKSKWVLRLRMHAQLTFTVFDDLHGPNSSFRVEGVGFV